MLMQRLDRSEQQLASICFQVHGPISLLLGPHIEHRQTARDEQVLPPAHRLWDMYKNSQR